MEAFIWDVRTESPVEKGYVRLVTIIWGRDKLLRTQS